MPAENRPGFAAGILAVPIKAMVEKICADRTWVVAFALAAGDFHLRAEKHREIAELMEQAAVRIRQALGHRPDVEEILAWLLAKPGPTFH